MIKINGYSSWRLLISAAALAACIALAPAATYAEPADTPTTTNTCGDATFLGFPAWYNGLVEPGTDHKGKPSCEIKSPSDLGEDGLNKFIWVIVSNIVVMILRAAGYASVAFIIYGGYKYMISAGSPDGMVAARKTIMNAVIGLIISLAAVAIVNTIANGFKVG